MINTFSASFLKSIEKNKDKAFSQTLTLQTDEMKLGNELHSLIYYYIKGFDIRKIEKNLSDTENKIWNNLQESGILNQNFIMAEEGFLVKIDKYFLEGRFDCVYKDDLGYTIIDWKTKTIPKNPKDDIQTAVYLYCASKLLKTEKIKMKYVSLETLENEVIEFQNTEEYKKRILNIIESIN